MHFPSSESATLFVDIRLSRKECRISQITTYIMNQPTNPSCSNLHHACYNSTFVKHKKKPCSLDLNCYYFAIVATLISSMINKDLRLIYLYEFKRGTNATETARNINEAFGDKSAEVRTVQRWFARFRNGDESCMVKQYHGRKRKFDNVRLRTVVEADPGTTVRRLAKKLGTGKSIISTHLSRIGKRKKLDKFVPHELTEAQQNRRYQICSSLML